MCKVTCVHRLVKWHQPSQANKTTQLINIFISLNEMLSECLWAVWWCMMCLNPLSAKSKPCDVAPIPFIEFLVGHDAQSTCTCSTHVAPIPFIEFLVGHDAQSTCTCTWTCCWAYANGWPGSSHLHQPHVKRGVPRHQ